MNSDNILLAIDAEISRLQQARSFLSSDSDAGVVKRGPGRPKKLVAPQKVVAVAQSKMAKRVMTAEGRARIAAAQKKRWAVAKKAAKTAA